MEAASMGDRWPRSRSTREHSLKISDHPSTSSLASECTSQQDNSSVASKGAIAHLPQDTKWWLLMQPDLGQQLNALEAELSGLSTGYVAGIAKSSKDRQLCEEFAGKTCMKHDNDTVYSPPVPYGHHSGDWDSLNFLGSELTDEIESSEWMGRDKAGTWWRNAGKDELASFVAQRSLQRIENCDLPRPRKKELGEWPSTCADGILREKLMSSTRDLMSGRSPSTPNSLTSSSTVERECVGGDRSCNRGVLDASSSVNREDTVFEDQIYPEECTENNFTTAQLLEALCHSQTHAREAEKAAQQAYNEKEHIVTLFFRQASQLFAYRQWLRLLQLESFYLQLKNGNIPAPGLLPGVLSRLPPEGKARTRGTPYKTGKRRHGKSRSAAAFAASLGLAGAGFLLGWTVGWLLFSPLN